MTLERTTWEIVERATWEIFERTTWEIFERTNGEMIWRHKRGKLKLVVTHLQPKWLTVDRVFVKYSKKVQIYWSDGSKVCERYLRSMVAGRYLKEAWEMMGKTLNKDIWRKLERYLRSTAELVGRHLQPKWEKTDKIFVRYFNSRDSWEILGNYSKIRCEIFPRYLRDT